MNIEIRKRNPQDEDMKTIFQAHLDFCMSSTPLEHVHALDVSKLVSSDISVFGAYLNNEKIGSEDFRPRESDLIHGRFLVLRKGKRDLAAVEVR